jgi:tRNA dimethylallyltransferase
MVYVIVGPTGIGKTSLSIALAKHFDTEVISGDSIQVYKELTIGSAKVSIDEMDGVPHHLIDILEPTEDFSVAVFQQMVREKIEQINNKNKIPIIAGGTGLYIKSVLYDYNFIETKRDLVLEEKYQQLTNIELHQILQEKDEESALKIHPNNRKRVFQAISRSETNKVSLNKNKDQKVMDFKIIGLTLERSKLYEIINNRVDKMIEDGLIGEVRNLFDKGINSNSVSAIGYKELYRYFRGEWTKEEAIDKIKQHSRNLAKKQFTFFNNQFDITWIQTDLEHFDNTIKEAINILSR